MPTRPGESQITASTPKRRAWSTIRSDSGPPGSAETHVTSTPYCAAAIAELSSVPPTKASNESSVADDLIGRRGQAHHRLTDRHETRPGHAARSRLVVNSATASTITAPRTRPWLYCDTRDHVEAVVDECQQHRPTDRAEHAAAPAGERRAAHDDGGDRRQFESVAGRRGADPGANHQRQPCGHGEHRAGRSSTRTRSASTRCRPGGSPRGRRRRRSGAGRTERCGSTASSAPRSRASRGTRTGSGPTASYAHVTTDAGTLPRPRTV